MSVKYQNGKLTSALSDEIKPKSSKPNNGERVPLRMWWIFFHRYLFSSRSGSVVRTMAAITWLAILICVFSLVLVSSIMNGFNRTQSARLLDVEPHLYFKSQQNLDPIRSEILKSYPDIEVGSYAQNDVIIKSLTGKFSGAIAKGTSQSLLYGFLNRSYLRQFKVTPSEGLPMSHAELAPNEIILGAEIAWNLRVLEGDEVLIVPPDVILQPKSEAISFERMRVKSIFTSDMGEMDSRFLFYDVEKGPHRFQVNNSGERGLEVRFQNPDDFRKLKNYIHEMFKGRIDFTSEDWAERNQSLFLALRLEKVAMLSLLWISILITCFSLITVITMLISQKQKDIQLLIAIGFSRAHTEKLFLFIGLGLCMVGLMPGILFGVVASELVKRYPVDILPNIYFDSSIPSEVNYGFVFGVAILCTLIAWVTAKIPVTKAARKSVRNSYSRMGAF